MTLLRLEGSTHSKVLTTTVFSAAVVGVGGEVVGNSIVLMKLLLLVGRNDKPFRKELVTTDHALPLVGFLHSDDHLTEDVLITCVLPP